VLFKNKKTKKTHPMHDGVGVKCFVLGEWFVSSP